MFLVVVFGMLGDNLEVDLSQGTLGEQLCLFENKGSEHKVQSNNVVCFRSFSNQHKKPALSPGKFVEAFSSHASSIPWLEK